MKKNGFTKKRIVFLILALTVLFTGCKKEETAPPAVTDAVSEPETQETTVMYAALQEIKDGRMTVNPEEHPMEILASSNLIQKITVPICHMEASPEPKTGDRLKIVYRSPLKVSENIKDNVLQIPEDAIVEISIENDVLLTGVITEIKGETLYFSADGADYQIPGYAEWIMTGPEYCPGDTVTVHYDGRIQELYPMIPAGVTKIDWVSAGEKETEEESAEEELPVMIMVNGKLYYDSSEKRDPSLKTCGTMDGKIWSWIAGSVPFEDNMSNIGKDWEYQYGGEGEIDLQMEDGWHIFKEYQAGMNKTADQHIRDFIKNPAALPAYDYDKIKGDRRDPQMAAIYDYILGLGWFEVPTGSVMIPSFCTFLSEMEDEDTVKIYGNFWTFVYSKHGQTFFCEAGGENPGVFYLKKDGEEYTVEKFDRVGDGAQYAEDIDRICAGNKTLKDQFYEAASGRGETVENMRTFVIAEYARKNNLDVTAWQDFGWDPVLVLELNPGGREE